MISQRFFPPSFCCLRYWMNSSILNCLRWNYSYILIVLDVYRSTYILRIFDDEFNIGSTFINFSLYSWIQRIFGGVVLVNVRITLTPRKGTNTEIFTTDAGSYRPPGTRCGGSSGRPKTYPRVIFSWIIFILPTLQPHDTISNQWDVVIAYIPTYFLLVSYWELYFSSFVISPGYRSYKTKTFSSHFDSLKRWGALDTRYGF